MSGVLHLENVVGRYGAVTAVNDLNLSIDAGSRHAIIGPNGAGKSTLLHLIAGTLRPAHGRIRLGDVDITRAWPAARARYGIGRTFQHPGLAPGLTCADNVVLARRGKHAAPALEVLARVGMAEQAHTRAGQLSYGQRRLLEIAVALAAGPRLLLLDEPCAGLGPADITHLGALLQQLGDDTTIVLVEHHLDLVWQLADTVTVLHHGTHLATGTPTKIRADQQVRDAYLTTGRPTPAARRTANGPVLLTVESLRAGYHGAPVLDGIALQVASGSIHAVLGRNGAGKSTLMGSLGGLHPATSGRITLDGTTVPTTAPHELAAHGIALVPQGRRLFATLTVREHLRLAATRSPDRKIWDNERVLALLPALAGLLGRYPGQLSGGQQQMLALARALLANPRLLLLDEPTEGLAPALIDQIGDALTQIAADGITVLIAEQNLPFALAIADHLTVLDRGRVALTTDVTALGQPDLTARLHELLGVADSTPIGSQTASPPGG